MLSDTLVEEVNTISAKPKDVDYLVPRVQVQWSKHTIEGALLDGGSGVNILLEFLYIQLKLPKLEEAPFLLKMSDQRRVQPLGILKK